MAKSYRGLYRPTNPKKYVGDSSNIVCRSNWERKFCQYCDLNENVIEWGSEEFFIPYRSPLDDRIHRYFPDFYMKIKENSGRIKRYVIEVKPYKQTIPPTKTKNKKSQTYISEVKTYAVNDAKWKAAREFCEDRMLEFKIITEKELF